MGYPALHALTNFLRHCSCLSTYSTGRFKEVNGGFLHVEDGSTARFLKDLEVVGFKVKCSRDGDFCGELFDGGCVWNEVRGNA